MAGEVGTNVAASESHVQAIALALGQLAVLLSFVFVTVYLLAAARPVDGQLWTLDVAIVSFYLGQRVNVVKP